MEIIITLEDDSKRAALFGSNDRHLRLIRQELRVHISARDGALRLLGHPEGVERAAAVLEVMQNRLRKAGHLSADEVGQIISSQAGTPALSAGPLNTHTDGVTIHSNMSGSTRRQGNASGSRHANSSGYPNDSPVNEHNNPGQNYAGDNNPGYNYAIRNDIAHHDAGHNNTGHNNTGHNNTGHNYARHGNGYSMAGIGGGGELIPVYSSGNSVRPKTDGQRRYVEAMRTHDLVFCLGPAGTGKTYLATAMAVSALKAGRIKRICLVRPAVEAGEKLGYLPGDLQAKVNPYLRPLLDALHDMMGFDQVRRFMSNDIIEIAPLAFMRGRTLNDAVIILDEAQNTTTSQMMMFLTRLGQNSKMIITGDESQVDLPDAHDSGLIDAVVKLSGLPGIAVVRLNQVDIVRHKLVQSIVAAYEAARLAEARSLNCDTPQIPLG